MAVNEEADGTYWGPDGAAVTEGEVLIDGKWHYLNADGSRYTGWKYLPEGNKWCYYSPLMAEPWYTGRPIYRRSTAVARVLPRGSRLGAAAAGREETRRRVCERLQAFYEKYRSLTARYPIEGAGE